MRSNSTQQKQQPPERVRERAPSGRDGALHNGYRPRASTVERAREIREIAAGYIAKHGLWRFSMLSLARHLDCLLPTLCYYYKRREDLITDIVLRHVETLRTRTAQAQDEAEDDSPANALRAFAREYLLVGLAEQDYHRLMLAYPSLAGPADGSVFLARREALRQMAETRLIAHAPSLGEKPETAVALSRAMLDTLSAAAISLEPYGVVKPVDFAAMVAEATLAQAARS